MKTKEKILEKSRKLFNSKGIRAVSLRDIAANLGISYGNLTYHYSSKENLLTWIYIQMMEEHQEIANNRKGGNNQLEEILMIPESTFDISFKYLFLFQDYVEIVRNYPSIAEMQKQLISTGKSDLFGILMSLKEQGILRLEIGEQELDYLIEISSYMRSFYFMKLVGASIKTINSKANKMEYVRYTNKLLYPYLTSKGLKIFDDFMTQ